MFWSDEVGGTATCPECGSRLESESHAYLLAVRKKDDIQPFVIGNDGGYFCPDCPTIVLDRENFAFFAQTAAHRPSGQFVVMGLVDLEAIPPDKKHVPIGEDDNPIPLVKFTNYSRPGPASRPQSDSDEKRRDHNRKKRIRKRGR
jgi:hypothetical protein